MSKIWFVAVYFSMLTSYELLTSTEFATKDSKHSRKSRDGIQTMFSFPHQSVGLNGVEMPESMRVNDRVERQTCEESYCLTWLAGPGIIEETWGSALGHEAEDVRTCSERERCRIMQGERPTLKWQDC